MGNKNIININEAQLESMVTEVVNSLLKEGCFDNTKDGIKKDFNNARQKFDDEMDNMERRYDIRDGRPDSFKEVFEGNGWKIHKVIPMENENRFYASLIVGLDGETHGLAPKELVNDLNIMAEDLGLTPSCKCLGKLKQYKNVYVFACPFEN